MNDTHVDRNMRHGLYIVREVYPPAVSCLCKEYVVVSEIEQGDGYSGSPAPHPGSRARTSGDSSSKIRAPRVYTWIAFADGNDGPDIV